MSTLAVTRSYADGDVLLASDLDNIVDDVETFLNVTGVGANNILDGAVGTAELEDLGVTTGKIAASAVTTAKIADLNVTNGKIALLAVDTAQLAANAVTDAKIVSGGLAAASLATNSVTTAKILNGNVTSAKLDTSISTTTIAATGALSGGTAITLSSKNVVVSQTNAASSLGIIRGSVSLGGAGDSGEGYTLSNPDGNTTRVTFSQGYGVSPTVVWSKGYNGSTVIASNDWTVTAVSTAQFDIASAGASPAGFSFIVIGPR